MKCPKCGSVELKLENKSQLPLMKADRMKDLEKFGFEKFPQKHNLVFRHYNKYVLVTVNTKTRVLNINTPMGTAAFPEAYNDKYQDLIKADMVEEVL